MINNTEFIAIQFQAHSVYDRFAIFKMAMPRIKGTNIKWRIIGSIISNLNKKVNLQVVGLMVLGAPKTFEVKKQLFILTCVHKIL